MELARIFHQGRARVGCDAVRWQDVTTLRARAREEEQRSQRAAARLNRVCSARYKLDLALEAKKVSIHAVLRGVEERPGEICGLVEWAEEIAGHGVVACRQPHWTCCANAAALSQARSNPRRPSPACHASPQAAN
jgi:hypothetical protein